MIDLEMLRPTADEMLSGLTAGETLRQKTLLRATATARLAAVANEMLGALHATPALRHRILVRASRQRKGDSASAVTARVSQTSLRRVVPALSMGLVLTVMIGLGALYGKKPPQILPETGGEMRTYAAGSLSAEGDASNVSLYAELGENPPLLVINGRYYQMLTAPQPLPAEMIGAHITNMVTFTEEPSLAENVGIYSNIVKPGVSVYEVNGLSFQTACAAEVDGSMRLFQRVGYATKALIGNNESLEDTLNVGGQIASLALSGVGAVTDEALANELIYRLFEFGVYDSSELTEYDQLLTITLKSGIALQLKVQGNLVGACGAWACSEFFTQFAQYAAQ